MITTIKAIIKDHKIELPEDLELQDGEEVIVSIETKNGWTKEQLAVIADFERFCEMAKESNVNDGSLNYDKQLR